MKYYGIKGLFSSYQTLSYHLKLPYSSSITNSLIFIYLFIYLFIYFFFLSLSLSLLPGRPYIFLVRSVNRIGPGPWSQPLEVVSGAGPPDTPHPPHLACRSPHSVHLVWEEPINNGAGIDQYNIQIAEVRMVVV